MKQPVGLRSTTSFTLRASIAGCALAVALGCGGLLGFGDNGKTIIVPEAQLRFIHADRASGGLDVWAANTLGERALIATGREYFDNTGISERRTIPATYGYVRVYPHQSDTRIGEYNMGPKPSNDLEFVYLGETSTPKFVVIKAAERVAPNRTFNVVNAGRTGNVDVYVTLPGGAMITPSDTLAHGAWKAYDVDQTMRVRVTPAGNNGNILADSTVAGSQTMVFQPNQATGAAPYFFTFHTFQ